MCKAQKTIQQYQGKRSSSQVNEVTSTHPIETSAYFDKREIEKQEREEKAKRE